jgi:peptidoglycan/xylan/chitin deacetylase (PgdA/CDA1 family)
MLLVVASVLVGAVWVLLYQPRFAIDLVGRMQKGVLFRVPIASQVVALSLDDGPSAALTDSVLEVLNEWEAGATFFLIGERAKAHPEVVQRIRERGHEIGNHMMEDRRALFMSVSEIENQLVTADSILGITKSPKFFRPGSGWVRPSQLQVITGRGYRCCLGSVYPNDPAHHNAKLIKWFVLSKVRPGDIIILHEGDERRQYVLEALRAILPELRKRGFRVVPVGRLVELAEAERQIKASGEGK